MHLSGLSPFGPIFGKELRTASRRKRNYLLRVVYLLGLLLFLLLAYTITSERYGTTGASARMQQQEQLGQMFFFFFSLFCVAAMALVGPVLTSTAINTERLHKTLHVLLMTPLTSWQIVSGKLFSRLLTAFMLIGLSLPVLALVRLLGGVELQQMFGIVAIAAATAMSTAALGLLLSVIVHRAYAVILLSYVLIGVAYLFTPAMILSYVNAVGARGGMQWMSKIAKFDPFFCTFFMALGQMRIFADEWVPCVISQLVATAVMLVMSALMVRRWARREGEAAAAVAPAPTLPMPAIEMDGQPGGTNGDHPAIMPPPTGRGGRTVSDYPVLWRELRRPLMNTRIQRVLGLTATAALLVVSYGAAWSNKALGDNDLQVPFSIVFDAIMLLLACVISATAIAQEKEGDTWTVLLASPISGSAIVWGKAVGTARRLMFPMIFIVVHFFVFMVAGVIPFWAFLVAIVVIASFNTIWVATGVFLSLLCRRVTVAVIINLALPVVLYAVIPLMLLVSGELSNHNNDLAEMSSWWQPFYYLGDAMDHATAQPRVPGPGYHPIPGGAYVLLVMIVAILHIGVAVVILGLTAAHFDSTVGRARQSDPLPPRTGSVPRLPPVSMGTSLG